MQDNRYVSAVHWVPAETGSLQLMRALERWLQQLAVAVVYYTGADI